MGTLQCTPEYVILACVSCMLCVSICDGTTAAHMQHMSTAPAQSSLHTHYQVDLLCLQPWGLQCCKNVLQIVRCSDRRQGQLQKQHIKDGSGVPPTLTRIIVRFESCLPLSWFCERSSLLRIEDALSSSLDGCAATGSASTSGAVAVGRMSCRRAPNTGCASACCDLNGT